MVITNVEETSLLNPSSVIPPRGHLQLRPRGFWSLLAGLALGLGACQTQPAPAPPLQIAVSILPQRYFAEKIAGEGAKVNVMVEPGSDPHTYEPKPQQLQALSQAKAYVQVGLGLEKRWLEKFRSVNPNLLLIDSSQGITPLKEIPHGHSHGAEEAHDHDHDHPEAPTAGEKTQALDPHIWLAPELVKIQAQNIYDGLVRVDPDNQAEYQANLQAFLAEIDALDRQIRQNLAGLKNRQFIVFHPAWGYFAQAYDLRQIPIEAEGQEPSAQELAALIKTAQAEGVKVIFAQPQLSPKSAETIAKEIGAEVVLIDDLAPDWSANLLKVSEAFAQSLTPNP
ncbi:MAG: cation ABC transporter substrate-binding protein [Cyanobacteria bacterium RI_101]|nr:cation ABC transporter substrate-binding protein [Cyanobacteria bacterium RI_101]